MNKKQLQFIALALIMLLLYCLMCTLMAIFIPNILDMVMYGIAGFQIGSWICNLCDYIFTKLDKRER